MNTSQPTMQTQQSAPQQGGGHGLLSTLLNMGIGFATGGPTGAAVAGLKSVLGGGQQQGAQPAPQTSTPAPTTGEAPDNKTDNPPKADASLATNAGFNGPMGQSQPAPASPFAQFQQTGQNNQAAAFMAHLVQQYPELLQQLGAMPPQQNPGQPLIGQENAVNQNMFNQPQPPQGGLLQGLSGIPQV